MAKLRVSNESPLTGLVFPPPGSTGFRKHYSVRRVRRMRRSVLSVLCAVECVLCKLLCVKRYPGHEVERALYGFRDASRVWQTASPR